MCQGALAAPKIGLDDLKFVPVISTDTLQAGTTFYTSSGTVNGELNVLGWLKFSDGSIFTSTTAFAGSIFSSTNTWTGTNTFIHPVVANITGNAATVTDGAYYNINNNWAQTQRFEYGIVVETVTVNGDVSANTLIGSTVTALGQFNFDAMYGTSAVLTGSLAANTLTAATFTATGQANFADLYASSATVTNLLISRKPMMITDGVMLTPRAGLDVLYGAGDVPYVLALSTAADTYMVTVDSTTGEVAVAGSLTAQGNLYAGGTATGGTVIAENRLRVMDATDAFYSEFMGGSQSTNLTYTLPVSTAASMCLKTGVDGVTLSWGSCGTGVGNAYTDVGVVGELAYYVAADSVAATGIQPSQILTSTNTRVVFNDITNDFTQGQNITGRLLVSSASVITDAPTSGFDAFTISVLHFDNATTDETGLSWSGSPTYDASGKWSQSINSAMSLPGASAANFDCSSALDECTLEFWFKPSALDSAGNKIFNFATGGYFSVRYNGTSGGLSSLEMARDSLWNEYTGFLLPDGEWSHVAVVQRLGALKMYVNGTEAASHAATFSGVGTDVKLMDNSVSSMDEFRFSRTARWTTAFTPPTAPYAKSDTTAVRAMLDVRGTEKQYVLAASSESATYMLTVDSTTGHVNVNNTLAVASTMTVQGAAEFTDAAQTVTFAGAVSVTGGVTSSTATINGATFYGAKTHAQLQLLGCDTLPCMALSSDAPFHIYFATATAAGSWQDEAGGAP